MKTRELTLTRVKFDQEILGDGPLGKCFYGLASFDAQARFLLLSPPCTPLHPAAQSTHPPTCVHGSPLPTKLSPCPFSTHLIMKQGTIPAFPVVILHLFPSVFCRYRQGKTAPKLFEFPYQKIPFIFQKICVRKLLLSDQSWVLCAFL